MSYSVIADMDRCVRCGSCKADCPTYDITRTEGMAARGRVVLSAELMKDCLPPSKLLKDRLMSCLLCGMCEPTCPVGVNVTEAVYAGRARLRSVKGIAGVKERLKTRLMRLALLNPLAFYRAARILWPLAKRVFSVPYGAGPSEEAHLRSGPRVFKPASGARQMGRVAIFAGCSINFLQPRLGRSLINVLTKMGFEVVLASGEVCCGAPLRAMGFEEDARGLALRNVEHLSMLKSEATLSLCPTCTLTLKKHYEHIIGNPVSNAMDAVEFIAARIDLLPIAPMHDSIIGAGVSYHAPCHQKYGLGVNGAAEEIMLKMGITDKRGATAGCCGFGVGLTHPDLSQAVLNRAMQAHAGAGVLLTACPGCMAQLSTRHGNVMHIIEMLDRP